MRSEMGSQNREFPMAVKEPQEDSRALAPVYAPVDRVNPPAANSFPPADPIFTDPPFAALPAAGRSLDETLALIERREIIAALDRAQGQRKMAANLLRISRSRLYRRMEALGIPTRYGESYADVQ